jgi:hypothetical protein
MGHNPLHPAALQKGMTFQIIRNSYDEGKDIDILTKKRKAVFEIATKQSHITLFVTEIVYLSGYI